MNAAIHFLLLLTLAATASCSSDSTADGGPVPDDSLDVPIEVLLNRADSSLGSVTAISYQVLYSHKAATAEEMTHNVFAVVFAPQREHPFGGRIFASDFSGYHILFNGTQVLEGYPDSGTMKYLGTSQPALPWLQQRFVRNARLGYHHSARIVEKLRSSTNIMSMSLRDSTWEDAPAKKLIIALGPREPVTSGQLEILFRNSDAFPVSVTETLQLVLDGEKHEQFLRMEFINIEKRSVVEDGQFDRRALPDSVTVIE